MFVKFLRIMIIRILVYNFKYMSPPLCMGITLAIFILSVKVPFEKDLLHIKVNGSEMYVKIYLANAILKFV